MTILGNVFFKAFVLMSVACGSYVWSNSGYNTQPSKTQMISDLDFVQNLFQVHYAPKQWKHEYLQWDMACRVDALKQTIKNHPNITLKEYQRLLKKFLFSAKDFHVNVHFYSKEYASLPFQVIEAENRYFVCFVESKAQKNNFPLHVGDEILSFGNRPVAEVVKELAEEEFGGGENPTSVDLASMMLCHRSGSAGHHVPQGEIDIVVKNKLGEIDIHTVTWNYHPEKIHRPPVQNYLLAAKSLKKPTKPTPQEFLNQVKLMKDLKSSVACFKMDREEEEEEELNPFDMGQPKSYIPELGKILWKAEEDLQFHAYIYLNEHNKKIGYIRIPSYACTFAAPSAEFEYIMSMFKSGTDAIVVDQINNPGGSVMYLYFLASHFSQKALKTPVHKMTITQKEVDDALNMIVNCSDLIETLEYLEANPTQGIAQNMRLHGYPTDLEFFKKWKTYYEFIVEQWTNGNTFTEPSYLFGVDYIKPSKYAYEKPVLVVVNSLCFSGGDFFPALLQDNKAAKIFGTKTAGAGGFVMNVTYPNLLGVEEIRYTASIAERENNQPIENLGVTPDIQYELTPTDVKNGFQDYKNAINQAVNDLLTIK